MLKCITIATIHNSIFIQLLSSGIWISPLLWNTACLSYKILLYLFIMPLAEIFHLCWWNSMVCVTFFPWNDCKRGIKVRIISEINFVVKMNEGGFSKNIFQLENSDLSVLKLLAKPNQLEEFFMNNNIFQVCNRTFQRRNEEPSYHCPKAETSNWTKLWPYATSHNYPSQYTLRSGCFCLLPWQNEFLILCAKFRWVPH